MDDKDMIIENFDETPDLITLSDDEGNEFTLEVLDELDLDGNYYVAMLPVYDDPKDALEDSDPLVIMKQVEEDGDSFFEEIIDENEFDRIAEIFTNRLSEIFDVQ